MKYLKAFSNILDALVNKAAEDIGLLNHMWLASFSQALAHVTYCTLLPKVIDGELA